MDPEQQSRVLSNGLLVVLDPGAVGGADLAEKRAALGHDFGDSKRASDFDLLTTGCNDFSTFTQRVQDQQDSGGIVVHNSRCFAADQLLKRLLEMNVSLSACAAVKVELEIGVRTRDIAKVIDRTFRQRSPAEICVQYDAGSIDHAPQRWLQELSKPSGKVTGNLRGQIQPGNNPIRLRQFAARVRKNAIENSSNKRLAQNTAKS